MGRIGKIEWFLREKGVVQVGLLRWCQETENQSKLSQKGGNPDPECGMDTSELLQYFAVPKGETDIRVVFNGTSCGLNDAL